MNVIVDLTLAVICFTWGGIKECHPILIGETTPVGEFQMIHRITQKQGYGGDVIQFNDTGSSIQAIHRVWTLNPTQNRIERLESSDVNDRLDITGGCINVMPDVYDKLVECCLTHTLFIK